MPSSAEAGRQTHFGAAFSVFFRDPDGLEGLVPKADDGSHPVAATS